MSRRKILARKFQKKYKNRLSKMSVLVDRTQGGTSRLDGHIELMLQRRLVGDDDRGVAENLSEGSINGRETGLLVNTIHTVVIQNKVRAKVLRHNELVAKIRCEQDYRPLIFYALAKSKIKKDKNFSFVPEIDDQDDPDLNFTTENVGIKSAIGESVNS
jgi:hypothetical protein